MSSRALFARARHVMPGGVNSPVRAMRSIDRDPLFIDRAFGSTIVDVDGVEFVDYVCSWGPLILGHAQRDVIEAVARATASGTTYGAPTASEVELAELIVDRVPGVEMVRMTSSGTEAAMSAVRLARAATGRDKILKFAGAYHGHSDSLLVEAGSGVATLAVPGSPGVTRNASEDTIVIPWNDDEALAAACQQHDFAAILAEPLPANMGVVPPKPDFLQRLRLQADDNRALLIFDEVISGFRVAPGGMQELSGVEADLVVLGKIVGGGLPAAAYAGRSGLLELVAPEGDVYQAGTLSGNPLAMAAGLATISQLDASAYAQLANTTERLADGLRAAASDTDTVVSVVSECGLLTVFFAERPPCNFEQAKACDLQAHAAWCRGLLDRGIYAPPSQFEAWFPSLAHDETTIDATIAAAADAFTALANR
ncbi:MAG: glutamate-1-semialdehyde 2,1-aminomutase [Solirubrobacterales bacterium]